MHNVQPTRREESVQRGSFGDNRFCWNELDQDEKGGKEVNILMAYIDSWDKKSWVPTVDTKSPG